MRGSHLRPPTLRVSGRARFPPDADSATINSYATSGIDPVSGGGHAAFAAAPEEFPTSAGALRLTPIQHASLMIQAGGKVLYVDPAMGSYDGLPAADYILISHIHPTTWRRPSWTSYASRAR
jgi:hypothetical protein